MNRATLAVLALAFAGCANAYADSLSPEVKHSPEELAKIAVEGPAPQSSSQRFVPDRAVPAPPAEASPAPAKGDWAAAPDATDVRITDPNCSAKRLREWYRVECRAGYVSFLGGTREGIDVGKREEPYGAWFIFPARKGDVRAAQFLYRAKWSLASDVVVTEQWLEGDPAPLISVTGIAD